MDRQCVHAALELVRERRIDHAMAFEPALSTEGFRYDIKPVMALAAGSVAGVALVEMGFILDMQALRCESSHQLGGDDILHSHLAILDAIRLAAPSAA
jgi:hypothetical protein